MTGVPAYRESGESPAPRRAFAARTSSGAGGSWSLRRLPNTRNAIAIVTPPVVTTVSGRTFASVPRRVGEPPRPAASDAAPPGPPSRLAGPPEPGPPWPPGPDPPSPGPVQPGRNPYSESSGDSLGD